VLESFSLEFTHVSQGYFLSLAMKEVASEYLFSTLIYKDPD